MADEDDALEESGIIEEEDTNDDDDEEGDPLWLVTFGDCISLLLTFFVLLLSFSSFEDKEAVKNKISFQTTKVSTGQSVISKMQNKGVEIKSNDTELQKIIEYGEGSFNLGEENIKKESIVSEAVNTVTFSLEQLRKILESKEVPEQPEKGVKSATSTFSITYDPGIYFHEFTDELKAETISILESTLPIISDLPNDIVISGYANETFGLSPEKERQKRLELAIARADKIARYLISGGAVRPERISLSGFNYSEYKNLGAQENLQKVTIAVHGTLDGYYTILKQSTMN